MRTLRSWVLDQSTIGYHVLNAGVVGMGIGVCVVRNDPLALMVACFLAVRRWLFSNPDTAIGLIMFSVFFADWFSAMGWIPVSFTWFPDVALIVFWAKVAVLRVKDRRWISTPIDVPLTCFVVWGFLSMAITRQPAVGLLLSLRQLLKFGLLYMLIVHWDFEEFRFRRWMFVLLAVFAVQVPVALGKALVYGRGEYAIGTYARFGGGLSTILPLFVIAVMLGLYFFEKPRLFYLFFIGYFQLFYFACPKRAYPMFVALLIPFLLWKAGQERVKKVVWLIPLIVLVFLILLAVNPDLNRLLSDPKQVFDWATSYEYQTGGELTSGRVAVIELVFRMLLSSPVHFAFGFGPGSMTESFESMEGTLLHRLPVYYGLTEFTTMSLEYGFVGVVFFLWMLFRMYRMANRLVPRIEKPFWKAMGFGFQGIWFACMLTFFYGPVFRLDVSAFLFWFLAAGLTTFGRRGNAWSGGVS